MIINKDSGISLYLQIQQCLENKINTKEWEKGHRLPSEKELAEVFDVSIITVKRAIQELVDKGLLYRQRGRGTFVLGNQEEQDLSKLVSLQNESWSKKEHPHKTIEFERELADEKTARNLNLTIEDYVYKIVRLKMEGNQPLALEKSFIPAALFPDFQQTDFENDLLYNTYVKKHQVELMKARIYFAVSYADDYVSKILGLPIKEELFIFKRYTYSKSGQVIEYSEYTMSKKDNNVFLEFNL